MEAATSVSLHELPEEILALLISFLDPPSLAALGCLHSSLRRIALSDAWSRGARWARRRFLERACDFFGAALRLDHAHLPTYDERAIARFNLGDRAAALRDLDVSVALARSQMSRLVYQAIACEMRGELQQSLRLAREACALEPANPRGFFEVGYVLQELPFAPDYAGSIAAYTRALELGYHREYVATFNRGWSREESGDAAGALKDYLATLEMNPFFQQAARSIARLRTNDRAALMNELSECERKIADAKDAGVSPSMFAHLFVQMAHNNDALGDNEAALVCYRNAIAHEFPRPATLYNSIGYIFERLNQPSNALREYSRSVECDSLFTLGLENRARLKLRSRDRSGALEDWDAVKRRDPLALHPYHALCRVYLDAGDSLAAIEELQKALRVNERAECIETRFQLAEVYCTLDRYTDAIDQYDAVLQFYPNAGLALKLRGHIAIRLGRLGQAEADLRAAFEGSPQDAVAGNNLGCLLFARGAYEAAEELLARLCEANGEQRDFKCLMNRAHCLMKLGRHTEAERVYVVLSERFPSPAITRLLDGVRRDPRGLEQLLCCERLLFRMQYSFETFMLNPAPYILGSPEYAGPETSWRVSNGSGSSAGEEEEEEEGEEE